MVEKIKELADKFFSELNITQQKEMAGELINRVPLQNIQDVESAINKINEIKS